MKEPLLLTTGPVPISSKVSEALCHPIMSHRSSEFNKKFDRVTDNLKYLFQTKHDVILLTSSGTGGMESAVTNLFSPDEEVIVFECGKFSERWSQIAEKFSLNVNKVKIPLGKSVTLLDVKNAIETTPSVKGIFFTHCETSTGAFTDLETILPEVRKITSALIIVDAISSLGVMPFKMDDWQVDVAITGSQKGMGLPPGLCIVALNDRAWRMVEQAELPRFYFDLVKARQALRLGHGAAFTPAISLIYAADVVLEDIRNKTLEKIWKERREIAERFREKISNTGFNIFSENPADAVTVIRVDPPFVANDIKTSLQEDFNIIVSGGQGQLINKVIRIGHLVNIYKNDLNRFSDALILIKNRMLE